ncbi:MAG TPA: N-acyl homoserine lactonase family protein [Thermoleophilaceae bacterium]|nr:N-acyl homoserine lactonase family protein [Thermoleophilaceae bacterium]
MATAAEPSLAKLPLSGGREGATVRLHPLLCARMFAPPGLIHRSEGRLAPMRALGVGVPQEGWHEMPVQAFLVEHPRAGLVLVDTGFHSAVAVDPRQGMGRLGGLVFKDLRMESDEAVPAQLRRLGIDPGDVRVVLLTHLHSDHASGIAQFPDARFLVSSAEWEAASHGGTTDGYFKRQFDHAFDYRLLDFESDAADSYSTFGRSYDVFGDGSVRMVFTPGHTAGHCSVVLRLKDREALIASDAAYTQRTISDTALPYRMEDEHRFRRSLREIQRYIEQTPGALVIPGHDMAAWRRLDSIYG